MKKLLIFGFILILLSSFVSASILHEQLLDDGSVKPQGLTQEGFSFTANKTTTATGLSLRLSRDGSPGTCYIDWYDTSGELPSGSTLSTTSFNGDSLGNTHPAVSMTNITLNTEVSVTYNTKYAIILKCPDGDSGNRIRFYEYEASDVYANGGRIYSTNGGSSFTSILGHDAETIVYYEILNATPTTPTNITFNPTTVYSNTNFSVNASGSTDLDNDTITYYYQFYDENTSTILKSYSTDNYLQLTSTQAHNNIKVYVKATDGNSFSSNYSEQITVSNTLPTTPTNITGLPSGLYVGDTLIVTGSGSTDLIDNDILTYEYKFYNLNDSTILQDWSSDNTYKIVGTDIRNTILIYTRANDGYGVSSSYSVSDFVDGANIDLRLTNEYDGSNIDIFSLTFENGTTLSTINNSIVFPTINPTETFNISSTGFITRNFNNYIINDKINLTLYQALIEVTVKEKITGITINSFNVTDGTYTGTTTNGTAYFYGDVGSYTLTINSNNYFSANYNINLSSLEQTTLKPVLGNVNFTINAYNVFDNSSINNFTVQASLGVYSESLNTTTGNLSLYLVQDTWDFIITSEGYSTESISLTFDELNESYNIYLYVPSNIDFAKCNASYTNQVLKLNYFDETNLSNIIASSTIDLNFNINGYSTSIITNFSGSANDYICSNFPSTFNKNITTTGTITIKKEGYNTRAYDYAIGNYINMNFNTEYNLDLFLIRFNESNTIKFNWLTNTYKLIDGTMNIYKCLDNGSKSLVDTTTIDSGIAFSNLEFYFTPYSYEVIYNGITYSDGQFNKCHTESSTERTFYITTEESKLVPVLGLLFVDCTLIKVNNTVTMYWGANPELTDTIQACIVGYRKDIQGLEEIYRNCSSSLTYTKIVDVPHNNNIYLVRGEITQNDKLGYCRPSLEFNNNSDFSDKLGQNGLILLILMIVGLSLYFANNEVLSTIGVIIALIFGLFLGITKFGWLTTVFAVSLLILAIYIGERAKSK